MKRIILNKFIIVALVIIAIMSLFNVVAGAATGKCGETLTWTTTVRFDSEGHIVIEGGKVVVETCVVSGTGDMYDFDIDGKSGDSTSPLLEAKRAYINYGVTSIGDYAFMFADTDEIYISHTVKSIGFNAFYGWGTSKDVYYSGTKEEWDQISIESGNDYLENATFHWDQWWEIISGKCGDNLTWTLDADRILTISGTGDMYDYEDGSAPWYEQDSHNVIKVVIEEGVTSIGTHAFNSCNDLTDIKIPASVTSIGDYALSPCDSLVNIEVSLDNECYKSIDGDLYDKSGETLIQYSIGKADTEFAVPDGVKKIGIQAFCGCTNLNKVTLTDSVEEIGNYAFKDCDSLVNVDLGNKVTSIGNFVFYKSGLKSIVIPDSVTKIGNNAFEGCKAFEEITLPFVGKSEEAVGADSLFGAIFGTEEINGMRLTTQSYGASESVTYYIPEGLKKITVTRMESIPYGAFSACDMVEEIVIGKNVGEVQTNAFLNCTQLKNVTFLNRSTEIARTNFAGCDASEMTGYKDSVAEEYADKMGFVFNYIDEEKEEYITECSAEAVGGYAVVYVEFNKEITTEYIIVSVYNKEDILTDTVIVPVKGSYNNTNIVFKDAADASYVKVFILDSITSLEPLGSAVRAEIVR